MHLILAAFFASFSVLVFWHSRIGERLTVVLPLSMLPLLLGVLGTSTGILQAFEPLPMPTPLTPRQVADAIRVAQYPSVFGVLLTGFLLGAVVIFGRNWGRGKQGNQDDQ